MAIKQLGGVFGRNPTFNDVTIEGQLTFDGDIDINSDLKIDGNLDLSGDIDFGTTGAKLHTVNDDLVAGTGDTALRFHDGDNAIYPVNVSSGIKVNGAVTLGDNTARLNNIYMAGDLIVSSGSGIDFSATAGTGTSELFDDYEEGTWTPVIYGSSSAGTATYSNQTGNYTKVGNLVCAVGRVSYSGHTGTGSMRMSGLPFTATSTNFMEPPIIVFGSDISLTANNYLVGTVKRSDTYVEYIQTPVGGGTTSAVTVDTGGSLFFTITYQAS